MSDERYLIVNADDFGLSAGVNRGIAEAHEGGIVTSASLMVRPSAAAAAAAYGRERPSLSLGLHIDLGEWVYDGGAWTPAYEVVPTDDVGAVEEEVARQLAAFRRLVGRDPTHIDSHQHVHRREPVRSVAAEAARRLAVPLRHHSRRVGHCGAFYGQMADGQSLERAISVAGLIEILASLAPGVTELACHPGLDKDLQSAYRGERAKEVGVLRDPRVREAIDARGIMLCSFGDVALRGRNPTP